MSFGNIVFIFTTTATLLSFAVLAYFFIKSLDEKAGENNKEKNEAYTEKIQTLGALTIAFAVASAASLIIFPT